MDFIIDELQVYPEIKTFKLVNLFTNIETLVVEKQLIEAFGEEGYMKIKAGRNNAWLLVENN